MLLLNKYDLCIFDCDGVIFDSNDLKIQAMEEVLKSNFFSVMWSKKKFKIIVLPTPTSP